MTWKAVHPNSTTKERVPDVEGAPTFEFGFWPPLEGEILRTFIARVGPETAADTQHEYLDRMVAYGVRGWSGFLVDGVEIPCYTEEVVSGEVKVRRLTASSLEVIYANKLRGELALKCYLFNTLTATQKADGLRLPSGQQDAK